MPNDISKMVDTKLKMSVMLNISGARAGWDGTPGTHPRRFGWPSRQGGGVAVEKSGGCSACQGVASAVIPSLNSLSLSFE